MPIVAAIGAIGAVASAASAVKGLVSKPEAGGGQAAQQQVASNNSVGNALNGSNGSVKMEIPVDKAGEVAKFIATA